MVNVVIDPVGIETVSYTHLNCADKIFTLLPEDVSDPFGGDLDTYRRAAAEIDRGISGIIGRLTE